MKIKQEDGTEIEVFTEAEVSERVKNAETAAADKAVEDFKVANPDKSAELETLKVDLAKKEADLDAALKAGGNDAQIARLRQERDDAKKAEEAAKNDFTKKFDDFKTEMLGDTKEELLKALAGTDAELRKKIELEFEKYRPDETSRAAIKERMEKAYLLATGDAPKPGLLDGASGGGDRGDGGGYQPPEKKNEQTDNGKAIAKVLGISEADRKAKEEYDKFRESTGTV